jgi:hypothetical protein
MTITEGIKKAQAVQAKRKGPVWKGPEIDGITQSLLGRFLCCRERFRLLVVEGLKPADRWDSKLGFGNMWHICEESHSANDVYWQQTLEEHTKEQMKRYRFQQAEIADWHAKCVAEFPIYVDYWAKHKDVQKRTPLIQEETFDVRYEVPSRRMVRLRGKWDAVDLIDKRIWLQENKTKSQIDRDKIKRQMKFDLQTMTYLIALKEADQQLPTKGAAVAGVRYNVVRRSAHKTIDSMLKKIDDDLKAKRGAEWFLRFEVEVTAKDIDKFKRECFNPILEQLCLWWDFQTKPSVERAFGPFGSALHWRHPYGIYNPLNEGGFSEVDSFLETGSTAGLHRVDDLFPELN